jgi:hypothetical protein
MLGRNEPRPGFRITEITAFTVIGPDDEEGVCAFLSPDGIWMPMVAADITRLTQLRDRAEMFRAEGIEVRERRFIQEEP